MITGVLKRPHTHDLGSSNVMTFLRYASRKEVLHNINPGPDWKTTKHKGKSATSGGHVSAQYSRGWYSTRSFIVLTGPCVLSNTAPNTLCCAAAPKALKASFALLGKPLAAAFMQTLRGTIPPSRSSCHSQYQQQASFQIRWKCSAI